MTQKNAPSNIPEDWKISEKDIDEAWNKKADQYSQFKNYFSDLFKNKKSDK